jgi:serine/threonine-protein kinase
MSSKIPDKIGSYEIDGELGRGAMGVVFRAHHEYTQREVALKVLFDQVAAHDIGVERFRREVSVSSRVDDPGVVEIFDAGPYQDTYYYAMEMLAGEELGKVAPNLPLSERLRLMVDVCQSLGACHEAGIVHRDLKPENIFVVDEDHTLTKIFDFGISSMRDAPRATATGNVVGTPVFMSPEQATDAGQATAAADVWSIGVILYELTSGRLPVDADSSTQVLIQVANGEITYLEDSDDYPNALVDLINTCLAHDPEDRFADAAELHDALRSVLDAHDWPESERRSSIPNAYSPKPLTMTHDSGPGGGFAPTDGISQTLPAADADASSKPTPSEQQDQHSQHDPPQSATPSARASKAATSSTRRSVAVALVICGFVAVGILAAVTVIWSQDAQRSQAVDAAIARAAFQIDRTLHGSQQRLDAQEDARQAAMRRARQLHIEALSRPTMPTDDATRRQVARIRAQTDGPNEPPTGDLGPSRDWPPETTNTDDTPSAASDTESTRTDPSPDGPSSSDSPDQDAVQTNESDDPSPKRAGRGAAPSDESTDTPDAGTTSDPSGRNQATATGIGEASPRSSGDKQGAPPEKASSTDEPSADTGTTTNETRSADNSPPSDSANTEQSGTDDVDSTKPTRSPGTSPDKQSADKDDTSNDDESSEDDEKPEFFSF